MSKENPKYGNEQADEAQKKVLARIEFSIEQLDIARAAAWRWPGWQSTLVNLCNGLEATTADFKRWQEEQTKGGAL